MRTVFYILTTIAVIGLAFWAYRENYATQRALTETRALRTEIRIAHERLSVLRAEWAYLNRPDRLRDLADINFERLGLIPLDSSQFGFIDQVAYPPVPLLPITNPIDVSNLNDPTTENVRP